MILPANLVQEHAQRIAQAQIIYHKAALAHLTFVAQDVGRIQDEATRSAISRLFDAMQCTIASFGLRFVEPGQPIPVDPGVAELARKYDEAASREVKRREEEKPVIEVVG